MSVFTDEWRRCLREQYKYVIRNQDRVTRPSLTDVLHSVGFTDDELRQLEIEATMRVEDVPDDFVLDLDILQPVGANQAAANHNREFMPHPLECQCPECVKVNLVPHNEEGQPLPKDELLEMQQHNDSPRQLRLF